MPAAQADRSARSMMSNLFILITMEKTTIGQNAGRVWHRLNGNGEMSINALSRELGLGEIDTALAVGWLAREDKVCIRRSNNLLLVSIHNVEFSFG